MSTGNTSAKPKLACEIAADRVLVGRLGVDGRSLEACAAANWRRQRGSGPGGRQLAAERGGECGRARDLEQRGRAIARRDRRSSGRGGAGVLLEFDTLPSDSEEAAGVVRFRMKKSLPFDVDKARVSYHAHKTGDGVRVVAAVALASVLEDYETAFRQAGFSPGVLLPSMLAALGAAEGQRPTLVVKVDARTTSIAILNADQLQLFRTLENTRGVTITGEQLAEDVYPSVVFFQDTYHLNIEKIFVAGLSDTGSAAPALRAQTGADVQELVNSSQLGVSTGGSVPRWRMAGVVGALIS